MNDFEEEDDLALPFLDLNRSRVRSLVELADALSRNSSDIARPILLRAMELTYNEMAAEFNSKIEARSDTVIHKGTPTLN